MVMAADEQKAGPLVIRRPGPDAEDIEYWQKPLPDDHSGLQIPWSKLRSGNAADSDLKGRKVFHGRMMTKADQIKEKYLSNMPFCVRDNEDGTYTVFDGNHRYHAIGYWISEGHPFYHKDFKIPCVVYQKAIPSAIAMSFATITNDVQCLASGGTPLDFLRFLKNIIDTAARFAG